MPTAQRHAIDATIAGLDHCDLWYDFWQNPESGSALTKLVEAFIPLAHRVMERVAIRLPAHVAVEDLFQSALVGLYHAISRFDPAQGVRFETFAAPRIKGAILDELRSADHASRSTRSLIRRIETTIREWTAIHKTPPNEEDLAHEMDLSPSQLASVLLQGQPLMSLDEIMMECDGHSMPLKDILADERSPNPRDLTEREESRASLRHAFLKLSPREQKVLYFYYFEELRLSEIAELYGVTDARVCQIHSMAVTKLRALLGADSQEP